MTPRPFTVLAAVDASDFGDLVLEHALQLAAERKNADIHVLGVVEVKHQPRVRDHRHDGDLEDLERCVRAKVEEAIENIGAPDPGSVQVRIHARLGRVNEQILELAAECRADLIVLGRHGAGGTDSRRTGSIPALVIEGARCSVVLLSPNDYGDVAESDDTCASCITARHDSSGERWFCDAHATGYTWRSSRLTAGAGLRDQGIWF